jgi:hypothetical protein
MAGMGAGILECEELVAYAKDADFDAADEHTQACPRRQSTRLAHAYKGHPVSTLAEANQRAPDHVILSRVR